MTFTLLLKVFCQRNFVADFIQLKLSFIQKRKSSLFEPPFGRLRGNVRTSSIVRWKARVRLPIVTIELFSLALTVETLQTEICRRERFLKGERGRRSPTTVEWRETQKDCPFMYGIKISPAGSLY